MLGVLPESLEIDGIAYPINSDYRNILAIFQAFNDKNLTRYEQFSVMLDLLYTDRKPPNTQKAIEKGVWFINCGKAETQEQNEKIIDWEQDEQLIFSALNNVAGKEIRACEYLHWWTFMGFFNCIGEGLFSAVVSVRSKLSKGKRLEKWEKEFYRQHADIINLRKDYSDVEKSEINQLAEMLGLPEI